VISLFCGEKHGAMDYDETDIAATYDKARALAPETVRLWRGLLSAHVGRSDISLVVDLGCGTGRFTEILAEHFGVQVIGIDPSQKMVDQARRKPATVNVIYRQGCAEALPLSDGSADLVWMSMVYHHLIDPSSTAKECHRVSRPGGYVCIRNTTRDSDFPHRHFFPGLQARIDSELPSWQDIESVFTAGGFTQLVHQVVTQITAPDWQTFIEKSALRADSFLARLSDEDFQHGMTAMRSAGGKVDQDSPVTEEIDWFVFRRQ
jgi:ubiquinone/menaquinone biosynthesis C-methylase UbiE